jgi:multiple sugar transport system ATP-binding protein
MAEIKLQNLSKRWGSFVGVESFNLTVKDEEFLVLWDRQDAEKQPQCA